VAKFPLSTVHGCEARFAHLDAQEFVLGRAVVAGTLAHRAIQQAQYRRGDVPPRALVDDALALCNADRDRSLAAWLRTASDAERADVLAVATDRVTKFLECFPPLRPSWRPVTESALRAELCEGRVVLSGRVDLVVGRPEGLVANKALLDLKTGGARQAHTDDLRFYALIEALRLGVPPFRVGSLYLDEGRLSTEDIDDAVLEAATVRVLHGAAKLAELRSRARAPRRSPGPACRWCPLLGNCEEGRAQLRAEEDDRFGEERFGDDRFGDDRFGEERTPARTVGPLDDLDDPPLDDPPLDGEA
jgi:hypothetical protein